MSEVVYDLLRPFVYKKNTDTGAESECKGIALRRPKGRESDLVFGIVSGLGNALNSVNGSGVSGSVIDFINKFGAVAGDPNYDITLCSENIDVEDVFELSAFIIENFTPNRNT